MTLTKSQVRKLQALANFLKVDKDEIIASTYDMCEYTHGDRVYHVCTDREAEAACEAEIKNSLWAFNPNFLIRFTELPQEAEDMLRYYAEKKCEDANEAFYALVEGRFNKLVLEAIELDGRGHFLAPYDGEEHVYYNYYIYRIN